MKNKADLDEKCKRFLEYVEGVLGIELKEYQREFIVQLYKNYVKPKLDEEKIR